MPETSPPRRPRLLVVRPAAWRSIGASAPRRSTRSSARTPSSRRSATRSVSDGSATASCSSVREARARPRWRASSPRPSTAPTSGRPAVRPLSIVRGHREGRRSTSSSSTPPRTTRSTTCASCCRASTRRLRPPAQGLHHRRGPAHQGGLGRPPQDARGAAARRPVHLLHDRPPRDPAGRRLPTPALHLPPLPSSRSGASCGASLRPRAGRHRRRHRPHRPPPAGACATRSRCSTSLITFLGWPSWLLPSW